MNRAAIAGTLAIVAGWIFRFPSPLRDGVTDEFLTSYSLDFPLSYVLLAPFSVLADFLSFNSTRQHIIWLVYLLAAYWLFPAKRALRGYAVYLSALLAFLTWGALWPRPAASLRAPENDLAIVDFHSHTTLSHDGRRVYPPFTPERNRLWHRRQGFDASFITDHNKFADSPEARHRLSLSAEELSLHDAHVVVLGNERLIDNEEYGGIDGLRRFLSTGGAEYGGLAILSLPEYWKHHWPRMEELIAWGTDGIELVNGSPKAREFPDRDKKKVIELARKHDIFLVGVSDAHGWGSATFAWNALRIPGHAEMDPLPFQEAVIETLKRDGFKAVTIIRRMKNSPAQGLWITSDPIVGLWTLLRSLPTSQAAAILIWLWLATALTHFKALKDSRRVFFRK